MLGGDRQRHLDHHAEGAARVLAIGPMGNRNGLVRQQPLGDNRHDAFSERRSAHDQTEMRYVIAGQQ